ncbi:MAG: 3-phosphoshikimate 1-carboxyvinyltransferase [Desulfurococcales archaeon]|nr:3-phosphoshikimate 1-carboxyvinyltransferase [Desulfurococcales archaeon]
MILRVYPVEGEVRGTLRAPPSKSYTHRAVFASLLACGVSRIEDPLVAGDTLASLEAARRFGAVIEEGGGWLRVEGVCGRVKPPMWIDCRGSGTTLRIATAIASLLDEPVLLYGDSTLRRRPMAPLLEALSSLGAGTLSRDGYPPVAVKGPISPGTVRIDASRSSQFVTGLLTIAPLAGLRVETMGPVASKPYVDLTLRVLEWFGARFHREGYRVYEPLSHGYRPAHVRIPGDYSSASFILGLAAVAGRVTVEGLIEDDVQADRRILEVLGEMGARVRGYSDRVVVESTGRLEGVEVSLRDSPDLAPALAAVAAYAEGRTVLRDVGHLAFKESNRIESITSALSSIGVRAYASNGSIIVEGGGVRGGRSSSFNDHRIAMMLAVAAVKADGPVEIVGAERIGDSYPGFLEHLALLGVDTEVIEG